MSDTTNRGFLGVVKLNLPLRVERVELAPLVFVPAIVNTIYIMAAIASLFHTPETKIDTISKQKKELIAMKKIIMIKIMMMKKMKHKKELKLIEYTKKEKKEKDITTKKVQMTMRIILSK